MSRLAMDAVPRVLLSIALASLLPVASPDSQDRLAKENIPHSRQKRILWITNDGRLALPPGTTMTITPSMSMPFVRHPPKGFLSNMTVSFPFTIDFDKLGLTDNENPYGELPPIFARSMGRAAASVMADYVGQYLERRLGKRQERDVSPDVEKMVLDRLHGGERALLYGVAEDMLANFGMDGKECLLRAICEIHAHPLTNFGFLGEVMKLFFTPSRSPYASLLQEYVDAQKAGESGGECWPYYRLCPKSIFMPASNKYSKDAEDLHRRQEQESIDENNIELNLKAM
ncbi:uncharacterized protein LOC126374561 isoform X2 [Pectinophora gossypiella]|uniref:uncharacterized protein LOC126374561 isoform X2 n=1 Tax=Pectinophora gossypiella TaxID=13191 RepID=UPI00214ED866|nr:uncharacterized protein LOC126374561 isoform X2 [Pectinophora gossypiella]